MSKILSLVLLATVLFGASNASAAGYHCGKALCDCEGTADCKELRDSGWCTGALCCGTACGYGKNNCWCTSLKKAPKTNPNLKKPDLQVR